MNIVFGQLIVATSNRAGSFIMDQEVLQPNAQNCSPVSNVAVPTAKKRLGIAFGLASVALSAAALLVAVFLLGRSTGKPSVLELPPELLHATATHGGNDMAVATGIVSDENEAIYFLDFKTGDLTCWVYYPRFMRFGAKFVGNVTEQLPATKNSEYLMVTGRVDSPPTSTNNRPANTLLYVVDTKSGQFATYTIAANPTLESAGQMQVGPFLFVGGGEVRSASAGSAKRSIPNGVANPADPQDPNAPANPPNAPEERRRNRR
jgi:hypothetical protein